MSGRSQDNLEQIQEEKSNIDDKDDDDDIAVLKIEEG